MSVERVFRWAAAGEWVREAGRVLEAEGAPFPALPLDPPPAPPHAGEWVGRLLGAAGERALGELAGRFAARYGAVEAFHAGRPDDPGSYTRAGVRAPGSAALAAEARSLFAGEVPPAALDEALGGMRAAVDEGLCCFSLDRRFPTERETFYLLYGSHFLMATAVRLRRATGVDLTPRLRERGVPTLLTCAVPLERVPQATREAVCRECMRLALAGWRGETPPPLRLDFFLGSPLEPEHIRAVEHPRPRSDPLAR